MRRRLWQLGGWVAVMMATFVAGNLIISPDKAVTRDHLGHDFLAFYTAGSFLHRGRPHDLYNLDAVRSFEHQVAREQGIPFGPNSFGPYWNPPFYAWVFEPLATLPFRDAVHVWTLVNLAALAVAVWLLCRMLSLPGQRTVEWKSWLLVPMLVLSSMPFLQAFSHGQNTFISLLILAVTVTAWRGGHPFWAGLVAGLLFYKPQLAAVLAAVLILTEGSRALLGVAVTATLLGLVTLATMPEALADYLHRLPANVRFMQVQNTYLWERHATLKGFWRLLLQGRGPGEMTWLAWSLWIGSAGAFSVGLLRATLRSAAVRRRVERGDVTLVVRAAGDEPSTPPDRLIAATVATMPLLMPFYFDYDLLLLSVPAVLLAGDALRSRQIVIGRWTLALWCGLYGWMLVNPNLAGRWHVNGNVVLTAAIAATLIRRACREDATPAAAVRGAEPQPMALYRAA